MSCAFLLAAKGNTIMRFLRICYCNYAAMAALFQERLILKCCQPKVSWWYLFLLVYKVCSWMKLPLTVFSENILLEMFDVTQTFLFSNFHVLCCCRMPSRDGADVPERVHPDNCSCLGPGPQHFPGEQHAKYVHSFLHYEYLCRAVILRLSISPLCSDFI